jgi:hypothetical protein
MIGDRLRAWSRRVLFERAKAAIFGDVAQHLRLCHGSTSLVYIGETDELLCAPAAIPTFWIPLAASGKIADPEQSHTRKSDKLLLYAPISLFTQWASMPEDIEGMLQRRKQLTIVFLLPGLELQRVQDFRWILSALLDRFPHRHHDVVLTFSPSAMGNDIRYIVAERARRLAWLTSAARVAGQMKYTMQTALSYDVLAGAETDPYQFAALLISVRPKPA